MLAQAGEVEEPRASAQPAPGRVEVDEEAAERALERSLVRTGALLLPFGSAEIEPGFTYVRAQAETPISVGGETQLLRVTSDILEAGLALRVGLPWNTQLELDLPYRYVDQEGVVEVGFVPSVVSGGNRSGVGDLRVGLAKALARERGARPNLIGRVTWDTNTGDSDEGEAVSLGPFGSDEVEVSLTATKRQDPLVFVGNLSYRTTLDDNGFKAGDQIGLTIGALLAASPSTSLRLVLDQTYSDAYEVDGMTVAGSDDMLASLLIGASSIVGAGKFLDFSVQTGLTDAAPDYVVNLALAIRFGMPGLRSGRNR